MMPAKIVWAVVSAVLLLTPLAVRCQQVPLATGNALTQAQAIQRAADFCKAVGEPVTVPGAVVPPLASRSQFLTRTYWQPGWLVRFGPDIEIGVADSGVIYRYFGFTSVNPDGRPPGRAISRADALARSAAVLAAAHVTETLAAPHALEENRTSPPRWEAHQWRIIRPRQAQGVQFADQQATVVLQAETRSVEALAVNFRTPPPARINPVITQAQAMTTGRAYLAHVARIGTVYKPGGQAVLTWVTPETHSGTVMNGGVAEASAPIFVTLPPRLTWMCSFLSTYGTNASVPVDVVTGKVLPDSISFGGWAISVPAKPAGLNPAPRLR